MKNNGLISVIVPVYNVERYLNRCVDSLINQTYKNLEIILVDDGSTDNSPRICDDYEKKYEAVKVIHKKNGGQSSARNVGIKQASGDYIGFVDSDDWVAIDTYEYLLNVLIRTNSEAAEIDCANVSGCNESVKKVREKINCYEKESILEYYMLSSTIAGSYSVGRCLFLRSIITETKFREGKINEDIDFKYIVLSKCNRFVVSNQIKYFYFQSSSSTTRAGLKSKDFDLYDAADELYKLTSKETYGNIRFLGEVKKARTAFSLLSKIAYYGIKDDKIDKKSTVRKLTSEHRRNLPILLRAPIPFSRKVLSVMFAISFGMTEKAVHIARRFRKKGVVYEKF